MATGSTAAWTADRARLIGNADVVYAVGANGLLERSIDGGERWEAMALTSAMLTHVDMTSAVNGVIEGPRIRLETEDGGNTWSVQPPVDAPRAEATERAAFTSVFFDADTRVKLTPEGTLVHTQDGGTTWKPSVIDTRTPLLDADFATKRRVVLLAAGRVLLSKDGGATFDLVRYSRYPSPWIWCAFAALLAASLLIAHGQMSAPPVVKQESSIADAAASDRPIGWGDPDPVGLRTIALGLSRFFRNRRTEPPLTIAVTGEWGAGKSSLMNLLRHDLQRYGYRPVWFNAWHHQSGENLLGSLLANIHA